MEILARDHDTIDIELDSSSGLCVLCDNPVGKFDIGLIEKRSGFGDYVYLAHASCIQQVWEEREEEEEDEC